MGQLPVLVGRLPVSSIRRPTFRGWAFGLLGMATLNGSTYRSASFGLQRLANCFAAKPGQLDDVHLAHPGPCGGFPDALIAAREGNCGRSPVLGEGVEDLSLGLADVGALDVHGFSMPRNANPE